MKPKVLLEVENLNLELISQNKNIPILLNLNFKIYEKEIFSLVGESGSGKSLTSLSLTKLLSRKQFQYISGKVKLFEKDIYSFEDDELKTIRGKEIAYIFQDAFSSLNPLKKIKEQIIESYLIHISENKKEAIEKAEYLLTRIGITDLKTRLDSYPNQMSGGMLQRILIASALMCDPKLLIADEPTSALDVTIQSQLVDLLLEIQKETNMSILFISHDLPLVNQLSNRIGIMYAGQIVEMGETKSIISKPAHPYTRALVSSIPDGYNLKQKELKIIDGIVPSPLNYPNGCHFQERCQFKFSKCESLKPSLIKLNEKQSAACFLKDKK
jgi:peptide/nickel transport system ATP-binding protein